MYSINNFEIESTSMENILNALSNNITLMEAPAQTNTYEYTNAYEYLVVFLAVALWYAAVGYEVAVGVLYVAAALAGVVVG